MTKPISSKELLERLENGARKRQAKAAIATVKAARQILPLTEEQAAAGKALKSAATEWLAREAERRERVRQELTEQMLDVERRKELAAREGSPSKEVDGWGSW